MKYTMPGLDSNATRQRFITWEEPRRIDEGGWSGAANKLRGCWGWLVCGRLFVASFFVELGAEKAAYRELVAYVDSLLPKRHEPPDPMAGSRPNEPAAAPRVGSCQVADGGMMPVPAKR